MKTDKLNSSKTVTAESNQDQLSLDFGDLDYGKHFDPETTEFVKKTRERMKIEDEEREKERKVYFKKLAEEYRLAYEEDEKKKKAGKSIRNLKSNPPRLEDYYFTPFEERDEIDFYMLSLTYNDFIDDFLESEELDEYPPEERSRKELGISTFLRRLLDISNKYPHEWEAQDFHKTFDSLAEEADGNIHKRMGILLNILPLCFYIDRNNVTAQSMSIMERVRALLIRENLIRKSVQKADTDKTTSPEKVVVGKIIKNKGSKKKKNVRKMKKKSRRKKK